MDELHILKTTTTSTVNADISNPLFTKIKNEPNGGNLETARKIIVSILITNKVSHIYEH